MKTLLSSGQFGGLMSIFRFFYFKKMLSLVFSCIGLFCLLSLFPARVLGSETIIWDGITYDDATVADLITVITTTSPIPSIPSTAHLYPAQKSLFRIPVFALCKKIIVFDGIRPDQQSLYTESYESYKKNVEELTKSDPYFSNTELVYCPRWVHLTGAIEEAIKHVKTPFLYIHQHDLQIVKDFDLNGLIASMVANPKIKFVLLVAGDNESSEDRGDCDSNVQGVHFVPLMRCFRWSAQAQITTIDYYKDLVFPKCLNHIGFAEKIMHDSLIEDIKCFGKEETQRLFACYHFGGRYDGFYIIHSDGRNN